MFGKLVYLKTTFPSQWVAGENFVYSARHKSERGFNIFEAYALVWRLKIRIILNVFIIRMTDLTICALILTSYFWPTSLCQLIMWREKLIIMPNLSVGQSLRHSIRLLDFKFINLSKGHFHHCILSEQLGKSFTVFRFSSIHALQHLVKRILHLEIFHFGNNEGWSVTQCGHLEIDVCWNFHRRGHSWSAIKQKVSLT